MSNLNAKGLLAKIIDAFSDGGPFLNEAIHEADQALCEKYSLDTGISRFEQLEERGLTVADASS